MQQDTKRVLIAAGVYDIVEQVRNALSEPYFKLVSAFTHREAIFFAGTDEFDAVLVDVAMFDRHSKSITINALVERHKHIPIIAISQSRDFSRMKLPVQKVITTLDPHIIRHTLMDTLKLPDHTRVLGTNDQSPVNEALARRVDEVEALFDLSRSLTEVLELTEVLNRVVEAARRLTDAEEGMILLPDESSGDLYLRARVGIDVEEAQNFRVKTSDTIAGQVLRTGQPTLIGAQGPQKVKTEYFVNSLVYVPILLKGNPIGVLGVNNRTSTASFNLNHQELLLNLASYAAIAIENARIHEESVQRTRILETLLKTAQVVNSSLSLDETLPNICRQLAQVLNVNRTEIYEWEQDYDRLHSLARYQQSGWRLGEGPLIDVSKLPTLKQAIETHSNAWIDEAEGPTSRELEFIHRLGTRRAYIIPIGTENRFYGAVIAYYVGTGQRPKLSQDTQTKVHNAILETIHNISKKNDAPPPKRVYQIMQEMNKMLGSDWCQLAVTANRPDVLSVRAEVGNGVWLEPIYPYIDLYSSPDLLQAMQAHNIINLRSDADTLPAGALTLLRLTYAHALLAIPLIYRGELQGLVVFADTMKGRVFDDRDIDVGRVIVGQAATALENAHLVHDLERSLHELKDAQERLVQTARLSAMGELAAVVAHQINNPLTTIIIDTEMMLSDEPPDSLNYESLTSVLRAGKRAAGVARRLLAVSRPDSPNSKKDSIDVLETIHGVLELVRTHIERDSIQFELDLPSDFAPFVKAVAGRLDDVWLNLLMNAHDALVGQADARIGIRLERLSGNQIMVYIWDNGPGMPIAVQEKIFNPFFTTKPAGQGTGLGLYICRQVVQQIGGEMTVNSSEGKGTTFAVRLPIVKDQAPVPDEF